MRHASKARGTPLAYGPEPTPMAAKAIAVSSGVSRSASASAPEVGADLPPDASRRNRTVGHRGIQQCERHREGSPVPRPDMPGQGRPGHEPAATGGRPTAAGRIHAPPARPAPGSSSYFAGSGCRPPACRTATMATPRVPPPRGRIAGSSTILSRRTRLYGGCVATGPGTPSRSAICQARLHLKPGSSSACPRAPRGPGAGSAP